MYLETYRRTSELLLGYPGSYRRPLESLGVNLIFYEETDTESDNVHERLSCAFYPLDTGASSEILALAEFAAVSRTEQEEGLIH